MKRIAIYGGSFDPPGVHRREIARMLSERFDEVIVRPAGPRTDKPAMPDTPSIHRAVMTDMTFRHLPRVRVDLTDLEEDTFTSAHTIESQFADAGEVWHVVVSDLVRDGRAGESAIHTDWANGAHMWQHSRFLVLQPPADIIHPDDLPRQTEVMEIPSYAPSVAIRNLAFHRQPVDGLVTPEVAAYMARHRLYRATIPTRDSTFRLNEPRFRIHFDERNPRAADLAEQYRRYESDDPHAVLVLGGDGTMLHAIRQYWRERLPFYGLNLGHVGFLLNETDRFDFWNEELLLYQLPLLRVEVQLLDDSWHQLLAFNDAWVERATGQTAWLRLTVNGVVRMSKVIADGMLIATAAGSTSYARAMGATPMPFNTRVLLLVGSNVLQPQNWRPAVMPIDSSIEIITLDPKKRPLEAYVDGIGQGLVKTLRARVSQISAAELAFRPGHDPATKLAIHQFGE